MLGQRLQRADEIAARRARALPMAPTFTPREFDSLTRYAERDHPHRDRADFPPGHFRKGKGSCDCGRCKAAKGKRSKGEGKRDRRERAMLLDEAIDALDPDDLAQRDLLRQRGPLGPRPQFPEAD